MSEASKKIDQHIAGLGDCRSTRDPARPMLLSPARDLAGMDGNRTHPGRVIGAPQTVLKTAGGTSRRTSPAPVYLRF